jgi:ornithine cyclodeaminase/alanine dehydrogenase-like protein (mu-crystallin family)
LQERGQVLAIAAVRPLKQVRVYSRDAANRQRFVEELAGQIDVDLVPCESPTEALDGTSFVAGQARGRRTDAEITLFESQGLGLQDVAMAGHVYQRALDAGLGQQVPLFKS